VNPKLYDRLTNASIAMAVFAAILFDHSGRFAWSVGLMGIVSGLAAVGLYFTNQSRSQSSDSAEIGAKNIKTGYRAAGIVVGPAEEFSLAQQRVLEESLRYSKASALASVDLADFVAKKTLHQHLRQHQNRRYIYLTTKVQSPEKRFVDQVVEIVDKLCTTKSSPSLEFVLSSDGSFVIRKTRGTATWSERGDDISARDFLSGKVASEKIQ
jgi:hypothetical protein